MRECYKKIATEKEAAQQTARRHAKSMAAIAAKALQLKNMRAASHAAVLRRQAKPKALNPSPPRDRTPVTLAPIAKKPGPPTLSIDMLLSVLALAQTRDGGVF